jgi:hypothetical protein
VLLSAVFLSLSEKREIYLHISEKSCTFATAKISFSQSAIISRGFSRVDAIEKVDT